MLVSYDKPKGGKGKAAKFPTMMWRIPIGIKFAIEDLAALYRQEKWDGNLANLNYGLITGIEGTNISALVLNLINYIKRQSNWFESIAPSVRDEFVKEVSRVLGEAKPDSSNEIVVNLQSELRQSYLEIERLKQQLSNVPKHYKVVYDEESFKKIQTTVASKEADIEKLKAENYRLVNENQEYSVQVNNNKKELDSLKQGNSGLMASFLELKEDYARLKVEKNWLFKMYTILSEATKFPAQRGGAIKRTIEFSVEIATGKYTPESVDEGFRYIKKSITASGDKPFQNLLLKKAFTVLKE
ncbi:MAG: hypothetical protein IGS39_22885 [Calothrix sp. C42_A2020_038]|nr:hypothetical protein [Calothrix sp. C42_A2020_038]